MNKLVACKTCGAEIAKSAKVCPNCGATQKKRHVVLGIVLLIIGLIMFAAAISIFDTSPSKESATNKPTISMAEFNAIETGMTYAEVVEIIGSEGEVLSEVDVGIGEEYKTTIYMWEGEGSMGANANITFQGGVVTAKAQFGLK